MGFYGLHWYWASISAKISQILGVSQLHIVLWSHELECYLNNLDSLRIDDLIVNSTTSIIDLPVAITDYLFEFSESAVANIDFVGEMITGVTLEPANASINIDGLSISHECMPKYITICYKHGTVLIIGFTDTNYFVNEGDRNVTLTVVVRGGTNRCNKTEWSLNYAIKSVSAQCEQTIIVSKWKIMY